MKNNPSISYTDTGCPVQQMPHCVLCLGNFDGVHRGHAALLEQATLQKKRLEAKYPGIACGVVTFTEPTHEALSRTPLPRITDLEEKRRLFAEHGIDILIALDFNSVKDMSAEDFVRHVLQLQCNCKMAVCGFNFRFGAGGAGTHDTLRSLMDGNAVVVPPVVIDGIAVSSTAIRAAIAQGDIQKANSFLGRPFSITDTVRHGRGVGNTLGFATINQHFKPNHIIPAKGVYAACCIVDGISLPAVSNVGVHPTFGDGDEIVCETHILDFNGDLYGKTVTTQLHYFIRLERKFDSPEQLTAEVRKNIQTAKDYYSENIAKKV